MLPDPAGIISATSWSPVGWASDSHQGQRFVGYFTEWIIEYSTGSLAGSFENKGFFILAIFGQI